MNNMIIYVILLNLLFFFFFFFSILLYFLGVSLMMEWMIFSMNSFNMEIMILVDWISMIFISFIFLISSMVLLYSLEYMKESKFLDRFIWLVMLFILSMVIMIMSPNMFSILFGWDGLGVVSYCLVIYYQNYSSYNSGMVTVLSNRIGDVCILMLIGLLMMYGSWNLNILKLFNLMVFLILIASMTKSAQIPFSVWLPMAMAAPTPVSSLVHSSTLVTAGVYLLIRFGKILFDGSIIIMKIFLLVSVLTMFMSGLMANMEFDLKKIIALSTLSQLGLMMMILSMGYNMISFYHLLTHSMFKSLLFLCAGVMIHLMDNNQDIRKFGNLNEFIPFIMISFYLSSFSLSGFPFLAGFYSKDLIMEIMYMSKLNVFMLMMILLSLILTVSYSFRLFYYLYFGEMKFLKIMFIKESKIMNFSMFYLMIMSVISGSMLNWIFFFDFSLMFLVFKVKILTMLLCLFGLVWGVIFYILNLMKIYYFSFFFSSMWYLFYLYKYIYKPVLFMSVIQVEVDMTWIEFSSKNNFMWIFFKNYIFKSYKMMIFIYLFMLVFMMSVMLV